MSLIQNLRPPIIDRIDIIRQAEEIPIRFLEQVAINEFGIITLAFEIIYQNLIYPEYGIELVDDLDLGVDQSGAKILGQFDAGTNTAYIDRGLTPNDPRRTFTCWHEVGGHGILQGRWLKRLFEINQRKIITTHASFDPRCIDVLERQANLFASHAAAPTGFINYNLSDTFGLTRPIRYVGPGEYWFEVHGVRQLRYADSFSELCSIIAGFIRHRFGGLSVEALSYRLMQSNWIKDETVKAFSIHRTTPPTRPVPFVGTRSNAVALAKAS